MRCNLTLTAHTCSPPTLALATRCPLVSLPPLQGSHMYVPPTSFLNLRRPVVTLFPAPAPASAPSCTKSHAAHDEVGTPLPRRHCPHLTRLVRTRPTSQRDAGRAGAETRGLCCTRRFSVVHSTGHRGRGVDRGAPHARRRRVPRNPRGGRRDGVHLLHEKHGECSRSRLDAQTMCSPLSNRYKNEREHANAPAAPETQ